MFLSVAAVAVLSDTAPYRHRHPNSVCETSKPVQKRMQSASHTPLRSNFLCTTPSLRGSAPKTSFILPSSSFAVSSADAAGSQDGDASLSGPPGYHPLVTAYHEAGHAVVGYVLGIPPGEVSMEALSTEDERLEGRGEDDPYLKRLGSFDFMMIDLAGLCAEEVFQSYIAGAEPIADNIDFEATRTFADDDSVEELSRMATRRAIGRQMSGENEDWMIATARAFQVLEDSCALGTDLDDDTTLDDSQTAQGLGAISAKAFRRTTETLLEYSREVHSLVRALLEHRTLTSEQALAAIHAQSLPDLTVDVDAY